VQRDTRDSLERSAFLHCLGAIHERTYEISGTAASGLNLVVTTIILWIRAKMISPGLSRFIGSTHRFCCNLVLPARSGTGHSMARRRRAARVRQDQPFKGRQFTAEVILWAVRWYLQFPISYRDLELMLQDRGVSVVSVR
jgi:hypothetical protein